MKSEYPSYADGHVQEIESKLSTAEKQSLNNFLKQCAITAGEGKLEKIKRNILQFRDITEKPLIKLTKDDVDSFLVILNKSNRSVWTKNEQKIYLKKFLKGYYRDLEMIENIKGDNKKQIDYQKINENNLVSEKDVEKMLRFAENYREKALLFLEWETGARPQELVNLKWQDIKFEDDIADITLYSGKTRRSRTFPVKKATKFLFDWKQNYIFDDLKPTDYVFPSSQLRMMGNKKEVVQARDSPMTTEGVNKILRRMAKRAGIDKDVWGYLFRHTRATRLYEELPQQIVEKLMGHQNMAKIYAHISNKKARDEMLNKIYKIGELKQSEREEYNKRITELEARLKPLEEKETKQKEFIENLIKESLNNIKLNSKQPPKKPKSIISLQKDLEKQHKQVMKEIEA
jgi:integrase/recombinase XerD